MIATEVLICGRSRDVQTPTFSQISKDGKKHVTAVWRHRCQLLMQTARHQCVGELEVLVGLT